MPHICQTYDCITTVVTSHRCTAQHHGCMPLCGNTTRIKSGRTYLVGQTVYCTRPARARQSLVCTPGWTRVLGNRGRRTTG